MNSETVCRDYFIRVGIGMELSPSIYPFLISCISIFYKYKVMQNANIHTKAYAYDL
jgi:hypothetical protein